MIRGVKAFIPLYVDDTLISCKDYSTYKQIRYGIKAHYNIKEFGKAAHFLNINLVRLPGTGGMVLKQRTYMEKSVKEAKLAKFNTKPTPLRSRISIPKEDLHPRLPFVTVKDQDPWFVIVKSRIKFHEEFFSREEIPLFFTNDCQIKFIFLSPRFTS